MSTLATAWFKDLLYAIQPGNGLGPSRWAHYKNTYIRVVWNN